jgi:hypothetical protein
LHEVDAHLTHTGDPPFDVARAPRPEVGGGEGEQPFRDVVEGGGVEPYGETGEQPALDETGRHRGEQYSEHPEGQQVQVPVVSLGDGPVDDAGGRQREQHLQPGSAQPEGEGRHERSPVRTEERHQPAPWRLAFGNVVQGGGRGDEAAEARPVVVPVATGDAARSGGRVHDPYETIVGVVQDHPVVAAPVADRR